MLNARADETLIVQDGQWRFTRSGQAGSENALQNLYCMDGEGTSLWAAASPTYKACCKHTAAHAQADSNWSSQHRVK